MTSVEREIARLRVMYSTMFDKINDLMKAHRMQLLAEKKVYFNGDPKKEYKQEIEDREKQLKETVDGWYLDLDCEIKLSAKNLRLNWHRLKDRVLRGDS